MIYNQSNFGNNTVKIFSYYKDYLSFTSSLVSSNKQNKSPNDCKVQLYESITFQHKCLSENRGQKIIDIKEEIWFDILLLQEICKTLLKWTEFYWLPISMFQAIQHHCTCMSFNIFKFPHTSWKFFSKFFSIGLSTNATKQPLLLSTTAIEKCSYLQQGWRSRGLASVSRTGLGLEAGLET